MADLTGPVRMRGRKTSAGYPAAGLYPREIFVNSFEGIIYVGLGENGATPPMAATVQAIPITALLDLATAQTISAIKTFSASPLVPTLPAGDTSQKAVNAAFVATAIIAALSNQDGKASVRAGSQSNINLAAPGATIGGVTMGAGDRFAALVQTTTTEPGLYNWNGASAAATRATDADTSAKVTAGMFFFITEGDLADTAWELKTDDPITLGTTALVFGEFDAKAAATTAYSGVDGGYA